MWEKTKFEKLMINKQGSGHNFTFHMQHKWFESKGKKLKNHAWGVLITALIYVAIQAKIVVFFYRFAPNLNWIGTKI